MKIETVLYAARHKPTGTYFGERGYGNRTWKIAFAMLVEKPEDFDWFFNHSNSSPEEYEIIKLELKEVE